MGAEDTGVSYENLALCDEWVKIPMLGTIESLNVSVAAGIPVSYTHLSSNQSKASRVKRYPPLLSILADRGLRTGRLCFLMEMRRNRTGLFLSLIHISTEQPSYKSYRHDTLLLQMQSPRRPLHQQ